MKKIRLLGIVLVSMCALCAVAASQASAVTFLLAEWLVNGAVVTSELEIEASGEILLEDTKTPLGKADVLCSPIRHETIVILPDGTFVRTVLRLSGTAVSSTPLTGNALECTNQENCEEPLVWPVNLEWEAQVQLMEDTGTFFVQLVLAHTGGGNPGWEIECMKSIVGATTDECTSAESGAELSLEGTTLVRKSSDAFTELVGLKLSTCSLGGSETGIVEGAESYSLVGGGELTVSSEGAVA